MEKEKKSKKELLNRTGIFNAKNPEVLIISGVFVALSIILGKYLSITTDVVRLSFENLTIIMSGFLFGPVIGLAVGLASDFIGCLLYGYAINPYILIAAGVNGFVAGLISKIIIRRQLTIKFKYSINVKLAISVFFSHAIGSILIKSYGLYAFFFKDKTYWIVITQRIPSYIIIALAEFLLINTLLNNKEIQRYIMKITRSNV